MTTPYYQDDLVTLYHGDCIEVMRAMPDNSVHAIVTDPPYGLGFMGKGWDDLPPGLTWAVECLRVLKPGGYLLAFGGSRTWHRLAIAVEDAGFEIRDSIAWLYGSGFPKSLDVSKAIDKRPGVERHAEFGAALREAMTAKGITNTFDVAESVIGRRTGAVANWIKYQFPEAKWWPALRDLLDMDEDMWGPVIAEAERKVIGQRTTGIGTGGGAVPIMGDGTRDVTSSTTTAAQKWSGWGTALKPAFEPIVMGRKPLTGTVAANVLAHGTGAINVDGCRIATEALLGRTNHVTSKFIDNANGTRDTHAREVTIDNSGGMGRWPTNVILDGSQAEELDRQSGTLTSGANPTSRGSDKVRNAYGDFKGQAEIEPHRGADSGGASRFFPTFHYEAKAPGNERPNVAGVQHPTVKPLDLMRWLVRLVTPPGGTVLEPFAGSGTTLEACLIEGFHVVGIEREADYLPLIMQRITKPLQQSLFGDVA